MLVVAWLCLASKVAADRMFIYIVPVWNADFNVVKVKICIPSHLLRPVLCSQTLLFLDEIPPLPTTLHHLFTSVDDPLARHFRKKIQLFNAAMAMASFQANDKTVTRGAPGCFKVVGQVYRRIGSLLANEQSNAKCLQVYFLDPDYQATLRATRYLSDARAVPDEQDVEIFSRLRTSLVDEANNTYIASFLTVVEWIRQNRIHPEEVQIQLHETEKPGQGQHVGRFHLPTAPEVSVLLPSREQMSISKSSIVCSVRPQVGINGYDSLQIIRDHHRSIWPLLYPILFPHGTSAAGMMDFTQTILVMAEK
jgi:hypothetical protein